MALTRKMLKAMELDEDKISQIIDAYQSTIHEIANERDELKAEVDKYKAEAERLASIEKELVEAQAEIKNAEEISKKLQTLQDEYDQYKANVNANAVKSAKEKAYTALLKEAGVSEKRFESIIKISDLSKIELDENGKIKDSKNVIENIKTEWADFIVTTGQKGANTSTPPANTGGNAFDELSLAEKMSYANDNPDSAEVKAWLNTQ